MSSTFIVSKFQDGGELLNKDSMACGLSLLSYTFNVSERGGISMEKLVVKFSCSHVQCFRSGEGSNKRTRVRGHLTFLVSVGGIIFFFFFFLQLEPVFKVLCYLWSRFKIRESFDETVRGRGPRSSTILFFLFFLLIRGRVLVQEPQVRAQCHRTTILCFRTGKSFSARGSG